MLITLTTPKSVHEAGACLRIAVEDNGFGVMHMHNLKESMAKKGVDLGRECLIFEVCHPLQAKRVLDLDMSIYTALPCRISIYKEGAATTIAAIKPTSLLAIFTTPQLPQVAQEVEDVMIKIMTEAAEACA